ncbi:hypothetical protein SOVF_174850 [Spinacia oleracea]|nr:hypothetical protein SOVF_174850 [Spinacia oleracea]
MEAINIENKEKEQASQPKDVVPNPRVVLVPPPTAVPLGFSGFGGFSSFGSSSSSLGSQKDPSIVELKEQVSQLKEGMARMMAIQEGTDARISELQSQVVPKTVVPKTTGTAVPKTAGTAVPKTAVPTTAVPKTVVPTTAVPKTAVPKTAVPKDGCS